MVEYGQAIGSVVGATMVVGAVGHLAKKHQQASCNLSRVALGKAKSRRISLKEASVKYMQMPKKKIKFRF